MPRDDFLALDFFPRVLRLDFPRADEAEDFDFFLPLFFALRVLPRFFELVAAFLREVLAARFAGFGAFLATALAAFFTGAAILSDPARRPTAAPITPPITAPTGPATLPTTAPAAAPAASFEMGGI
ncbi:MAG TPA: hypothetical protein VF751_10240 [Chthoniobacterales bacterium]